MSFLCYILHDDATEDEASTLEQFLARPGADVGRGQTYRPCQVLLSLIELPADVCLQAIKDRTIIIPLEDAYQTEPSPAQWIATVINKLIFLTHPLTDSEMSDVDNTELTQAVVATLERAVEASSNRDILNRVETILETAQELAESLQQASQLVSCLGLYSTSNQMLVDLIESSDVDEYGIDVIASIVDILEDAAKRANAPDLEHAESIEIFSDCYVHLLLGLETSYALQNIDALIENIISSGRPATAALVVEVIKLSFTHGDDLFERDAFQWALQVYLMAAQGVHRLFCDHESDSSRTAEAVLAGLSLYAEITIDGPIANAEQLCGELRAALDDVMSSAKDERGWTHDS
ncbi:MAG: hypothetical protein VYA30_04390 [Myxococcota bacterium]|nr:hypothetical protein [Myxococcota bacterium]